ncbi:MAG: hypothetical protein QOI50_2403, partial [Pseudonocardiales bacterium]|nr:hypothetical protein [Pseudonocardiales bacterium]
MIIDAVVISPVTLVSDIGAGSVTSTRWLTVLGRT